MKDLMRASSSALMLSGTAARPSGRTARTISSAVTSASPLLAMNSAGVHAQFSGAVGDMRARARRHVNHGHSRVALPRPERRLQPRADVLQGRRVLARLVVGWVAPVDGTNGQPAAGCRTHPGRVASLRPASRTLSASRAAAASGDRARPSGPAAVGGGRRGNSQGVQAVRQRWLAPAATATRPPRTAVSHGRGRRRCMPTCKRCSTCPTNKARLT